MNITNVLHHLVKFATDLSPENRAEFHDAIDDFLAKVGIEGHTPPEPAPAPAEPQTAEDQIAALKAELDALKAAQAAKG